MLLGVIALAAGTMGFLAIAMGFVLGWANRAFHVDVDPRIEMAEDILPGANCGSCGYVGCGEYAEAVVGGEPVNKCTVGGSSCAQSLAQLLGVDVEETWPYRAVVHCKATQDDRLGRHPYDGEKTCQGANLVSGIQGCTYGCLGFGDCAVACDYDAIHVVNGECLVDYEKCTGCGACTRVCPRNIISMVPFKTDQMMVVGCSSKDFGKDVSSVCTVGCIGCKACSRVNDLFQIRDNLSEIDYDSYDPETADFTQALEKCPREGLVFVGKPSERDIAAVADEELPGVVEPDFKSTIDDTDWRG